MIVHLNVLGPSVEDGVLRKLDVVEVVTVDRPPIGHLHVQVLQYSLVPYGFACNKN